MLRILHPTDLAAILLIEQSVHVVPWTEETFKTCFQFDYLGWVIEIPTENAKEITGFVLASLRADECHILNLGVAHAYQRRGFGQKLLEQLLDQAKKRGASVVYLEVRRTNSQAISLYKKLQFHIIGERKDYYQTVAGFEDALVFAKNLHG